MTPKKIILHHSLTKDTGTVSWGAIRRYHVNTCGWRDIGYHYGVESVYKSYEILLGRMPDKRGAHTRGYNDHSIGICFVGNFDFMPPCQNQWNAGIKLVQYLLRLHHLTPNDVYAHRNFSSYKTCPGRLFDMGKFKWDLRQ